MWSWRSTRSFSRSLYVPQLCNHLINWLESGALTPFPKIWIENVNKATELLAAALFDTRAYCFVDIWIKGLMTKTKEIQQLHLRHCINLLFWFCYWWLRKIKEPLCCICVLLCFYYTCIKVLKKINVLTGALQNLPLLLSV